MILGKLQSAHPTFRGHFAPAYLVGSNMLRSYLFFIYGKHLTILPNETVHPPHPAPVSRDPEKKYKITQLIKSKAVCAVKPFST